MQRLSSAIYSRCRTSVFGPGNPEQWIGATGLAVFRRHRSGEASDRVRARGSFGKPSTHHYGKGRVWRPQPPAPKVKKPTIDPNNIPAFFETDVQRWAARPSLLTRLESFGIPKDEIQPLLDTFVKAVESGQLSTPEGVEKYGLIRFTQNLSDFRFLMEIDIIYNTILFNWASDPAHQRILEEAISPSTISTIRRLTGAANRFYPAEEFPRARKMHRKIIMHVGPTNSGKTHHALRALAASNVGVYAGPLRLLAHEIWERLNLGQIVPLGMDEEPVPVAKDGAAEPESALDVGPIAPAVRNTGNPKYARKCNMTTGEEHKIVEENAPLLSCTVEMLSLGQSFDVAVIDEIQMISDEQRGSAWTNAVLGVCAKEVHLCGEETAVPLIQALLKDTGDDLVVKRYKRLTPLQVEEESLGGDFSLIKKGDCIVTFRRSSIFSIQRRVEQETGFRCAVVYGRLPPEIRSEQAALFNDPNSGYDVIIGSDAIGMGLNLKIRRIIFDAVRKWDGGVERFLSVSQVKQIAGRAGRYGLHGDDTPGGFTTTLRDPDLPFLRKTLDVPVQPLQFARLGFNKETFTSIANALPPQSTTQTVFEAHIFISHLQPVYRYIYNSDSIQETMGNFIDTHGAGMTLEDRHLFMVAPIPWRDEKCVEVIKKFIDMYRERMEVDFLEGIRGTDMIDTMTRIERKMARGVPPSATADILENLEMFHKTLVVFIWMSFRNPVVFNRYEEVAGLKVRVEKALEWALKGMSMNAEEPRSPESLGWKAERRSIEYRPWARHRAPVPLAQST